MASEIKATADNLTAEEQIEARIESCGCGGGCAPCQRDLDMRS